MRTTELASFKPLDGIIIAAILAGAIFALMRLAGSAPAGISIWRDNTRIAWYPFDGTSRVISVKGALGNMRIDVSKNSVFVVTSSCPKGICTHTTISNAGSQLICVPNHIVVAIDAQKKEDGVDAINR